MSHSISYNIVSEACLATCVLDVATLTAGTILLSTDFFGSVLFSGIFNVKVITVISNLVICMNSTLPLSYPHLVLSLSIIFIIFRYWPEKSNTCGTELAEYLLIDFRVGAQLDVINF